MRMFFSIMGKKNINSTQVLENVTVVTVDCEESIFENNPRNVDMSTSHMVVFSQVVADPSLVQVKFSNGEPKEGDLIKISGIPCFLSLYFCTLFKSGSYLLGPIW